MQGDYGEKGEIQVIKNLTSSNLLKKATSILFYYSISDEINTLNLLEQTLKDTPSKVIYLPITGSFEIGKVTINSYLIKGFQNIKEPISATPLPKRLDLALVPGVLFDKRGYRLGRGGGWYDRLFSLVNVNKKIGLTLSKLVIEDLPINQYDIPVDILITEKGVVPIQ